MCLQQPAEAARERSEADNTGKKSPRPSPRARRETLEEEERRAAEGAKSARSRPWALAGCCPLETPHGSMEGFYTFHRQDGSPMEVRIPFFPLAAPATTH